MAAPVRQDEHSVRVARHLKIMEKTAMIKNEKMVNSGLEMLREESGPTGYLMML
jgi:hypothetical protein